MKISKRLLTLCEEIKNGELTVITPENERCIFGEGAPKAEIHIRDWAMAPLIAERGDVGLGEGYVMGLWDTPDLEALLTLFLENEDVSIPMSSGSSLQKLIFRFVNAFMRRNNRAGSQKNIRNHYDVGNDFYRLWLDRSMTYSSALFDTADETLEDAQRRKYARLTSLLPSGAEKLLEIGCGWGGFAEHAADAGYAATGVTVSPAQLAYAEKRLAGRANLRLQDYRDVRGKFDAIVSIEMIEAVGERYWPAYFRTLKQRLEEGGRAALQAIIVEDHSFERYKTQSDFIRHYTFPGGMLVSPRAVSSLAAQSGLKVDSFFRFGEDYARTLREWLARFNNSERDIRSMGHGDGFIRSWRYYLEFCIAGFAHGKHINVAQVSLSHA